jgi:hypothetical protein
MESASTTSTLPTSTPQSAIVRGGNRLRARLEHARIADRRCTAEPRGLARDLAPRIGVGGCALRISSAASKRDPSACARP